MEGDKKEGLAHIKGGVNSKEMERKDQTGTYHAKIGLAVFKRRTRCLDPVITPLLQQFGRNWLIMKGQEC